MAQSPKKVKRRTVLITGCNKGIGLEVVKQFLTEHNHLNVLIGCRNLNQTIHYDSTKSIHALKRESELSLI